MILYFICLILYLLGASQTFESCKMWAKSEHLTLTSKSIAIIYLLSIFWPLVNIADLFYRIYKAFKED